MKNAMKHTMTHTMKHIMKHTMKHTMTHTMKHAMKHATTRLMATLLAISLLLVMAAGCKKDSDDSTNNNSSNNPQSNSNTGNVRVADATEGYFYAAKEIKLPNGVSDIHSAFYLSDKLYFVSDHYDYDEESLRSTHFSKICAMNADGTGFAELTNYAYPIEMPPDASGGVQIIQMAKDDDGNLWVLEQWEFYRYDLPPDYDRENDNLYNYATVTLDEGFALRKLDAAGTETAVINLGGITLEQFENVIDGVAYDRGARTITGFNVDANGNIYVLTGLPDGRGNYGYDVKIYALDGAHNVQFEISPYLGDTGRLIQTSDGRVAYISEMHLDERNETIDALQAIDFGEKAIGDFFALPIEYWNAHAYPGNGEFFAFVGDEDSLFGIDAETGDIVRVLNWSDSNINAHSASVESVAMLPDGRIICNIRSHDRTTGNATSQLLALAKTPITELPDITVLTLATYAFAYPMTSELRDMVMRFNSTNRDYRIEVIDYHDYDVVAGDFAGITRLNTEIIARNIPDIIDLQVLPYTRYASFGLLEDLYPFLESDPDYSRSDLMAGALRATEIDGKLYQLFPKFTISTIAGHPSVLGSGTSWSLDELKAVIDAHPEADAPLGLGYPSEKKEFLRLVIEHNIHEYVDWNSGTANFDTESFAALLEFVHTLSDEAVGYDDFTPDLFATGRQLMEVMQFSTFWEYQSKKAQFGGDIVFKGFPSDNKSGSSSLRANGLAITTASMNKEGAWQFLRTMLDADYQLSLYTGFPTNRTAFDAAVNEAMDSPIPDSNITGKPLYEPLTQEDVDKIMELIDSLSGTTGGTVLDETFWNIIFEGAEDYFSGVRSAEDAARIIQNRASIYVSEQS